MSLSRSLLIVSSWTAFYLSIWSNDDDIHPLDAVFHQQSELSVKIVEPKSMVPINADHSGDFVVCIAGPVYACRIVHYHPKTWVRAIASLNENTYA